MKVSFAIHLKGMLDLNTFKKYMLVVQGATLTEPGTLRLANAKSHEEAILRELGSLEGIQKLLVDMQFSFEARVFREDQPKSVKCEDEQEIAGAYQLISNTNQIVSELIEKAKSNIISACQLAHKEILTILNSALKQALMVVHIIDAEGTWGNNLQEIQLKVLRSIDRIMQAVDQIDALKGAPNIAMPEKSLIDWLTQAYHGLVDQMKGLEGKKK